MKKKIISFAIICFLLINSLMPIKTKATTYDAEMSSITYSDKTFLFNPVDLTYSNSVLNVVIETGLDMYEEIVLISYEPDEDNGLILLDNNTGQTMAIISNAKLFAIELYLFGIETPDYYQYVYKLYEWNISVNDVNENTITPNFIPKYTGEITLDREIKNIKYWNTSIISVYSGLNSPNNIFNWFWNTEGNQFLYQLLYNKGLNIGLNSQFLKQNWWVELWNGVDAFLSVEILPNLTFGLLFSVPLVFGVLHLILWIWRSGD